MKHTMVKRLLVLWAICALSCIPVAAQKLLVYRVVGEVTYTRQGKQDSLKMNTSVDYSTEINIPYGAKVELLDEARSKRIILKKPGRATVEAHSKGSSNSVTGISAQYLTYVKKQMTNNTLVSRQRYSDYATVTCDIDSVATPDDDKTSAPGGKFASLRNKFNQFKQDSKQKHLSFREECNRKYIEFVRKGWARFDRKPPVKKPEEPRVEPQRVPDTLRVIPLPLDKNQQRVIEEELLRIKGDEEPRLPILPVGPIPEKEENEEEEEFSHMPFMFCGTELTVRLDESKRVNLGTVTPDRVADVLQYFSTDAYNNLLIDCLKLRDEHRLCDWAYLLMLKALADQYSGAGTDESALLTGFLYYQSGYKVRFATNGERLYLLVASDHIIFENGPYIVGGEMFYPLEETEASLSICEAAFPNERTLSLYIPEQPLLDEGEQNTRTITSARYPDISVQVGVNRNLLDFYNSYPTSYVNDDFTTRWAMYANTPMADDVQDGIYATLKEKLSGMSQLDAVNRLLNLVQTGLEYEYDDKVWGGDRAFFAEETLFYPFCDCEDRSILFTRLVRDILGMECVLIYYPGHLAAAVHFDEQPGGAFYTAGNGKNYTLCDPTYIGATVGMEMPQFENSEVTLIHIAN